MEFEIVVEGTKLRVIADITPSNELDFVSVYPVAPDGEIYGLLDERWQRLIDGKIYEHLAMEANKADVWADLHDDEAN